MSTNWADAFGHHEPANIDTAKVITFKMCCPSSYITLSLQENHFNGTMQFASLNVMRGLRPSRRDDIVSLVNLASSMRNLSIPFLNLTLSDLDVLPCTFHQREITMVRLQRSTGYSPQGKM